MLECAAALRDVKLEKEFGLVSGHVLESFQEPKIVLRRHGAARNDCVPGSCRPRDHLRPSPPPRPPWSTDGKDRNTKPKDTLLNAWDMKRDVPRETYRRAKPDIVPDTLGDVYKWMRDCPDYENWLVAQMHKWRTMADGMKTVTNEWRAGLSRHVKDVLPDTYNMPVHRAMLEAIGYHDVRVCDDIQNGFKMRGLVPDSMLYEHLAPEYIPSAKDLECAINRGLTNRDATLTEMLNNVKQEPEMHEVLKQTEEEAAAGKLDGPWEVFIDAAGNIKSTVPFNNWLPTRRFPRVQAKADSSYTVRPIDDCSASGLNLGTDAQERMRVTGVDCLVEAVGHVYNCFKDWGDNGEPYLAKGDHAKAYRQWPVHEDDVPLLVCLIWDSGIGDHGGFKAFAHKALPFGAFPAVWAYVRVASSVVAIARKLLALPQLAYMDDFFRVAPKKFAPVQQWAFTELHNILGIPLKQEKGHGPSPRLEILGLEVVCAPDWCGVKLTEKRRANLLDAVTVALRRERLPRREAQRLGGQLGFATSALFGRVGRTFATQVSDHQGMWDSTVKNALGWWQALLRSPIYHKREFSKTRKKVMAWVDGSWDNGAGSIGGVLFSSDGTRQAISAHIPEHLQDELMSTEKTQRNTQSELLAILSLLLSCPEALRDSDLVLFEDNTACLANVLAGGARDEHSKDLVGGIWLLLAVLRVNLWIEWIPSECNPADCFSRPDEVGKASLVDELIAAFGIKAVSTKFPATMYMDAAHWVTAMDLARDRSAMKTRHSRARTVLKLCDTTPTAIAILLNDIHFHAENAQIILGWMPTRRRGIIGKATWHHMDVIRLLVMVGKRHFGDDNITTVVMARNRLPDELSGAHVVSMAIVTNLHDAANAEMHWYEHRHGFQDGDIQGDYVAIVWAQATFHSIAEKKDAMSLKKVGLNMGH